MSREPAVRPPGWCRFFWDVPRAWGESAALLTTPAWQAALPRGDGHPVMLLPGFAGSDSYNLPLLRFLRFLGYHAVGWKHGRNLGHSALDPHSLGVRVAKLNDHEGRAISLVGHSLGGVFAREAARRHPERVRQVISLGSPIGRERRGASRLDAVYASLNRKPGQTDETRWHLAPPVPTTAVYSRGDGVVDWRVTLQRGGHAQCENVEVRGSHNGMTLNPLVWLLLADRLALPAEDWAPFRPAGWLRSGFPAPAWPAAAEEASGAT